MSFQCTQLILALVCSHIYTHSIHDLCIPSSSVESVSKFLKSVSYQFYPLIDVFANVFLPKYEIRLLWPIRSSQYETIVQLFVCLKSSRKKKTLALRLRLNLRKAKEGKANPILFVLCLNINCFVCCGVFVLQGARNVYCSRNLHMKNSHPWKDIVWQIDQIINNIH